MKMSLHRVILVLAALLAVGVAGVAAEQFGQHRDSTTAREAACFLLLTVAEEQG
jgi:hypothetical protein